MKNLFVLLIVIFGATQTNAQFTSGSITAAGLTCAMCTKAIFKALQKTPGVQSVDVDIKSSAFVVKFTKDQAVSPDKLKAAVEDAGFSVAKLQLTGDLSGVQVKNDAHVLIGNNTYHFIKVKPATLGGNETITLVDKNYLSAKEHKKYQAASSYPCVETGKADVCCAKAGVKGNSRIYHVTM